MIGINEIGLYEIKIDFGKMETYITNNIIYTENDFNTAKIKAQLVKNEEIIDLTDIKVEIKIMTASGATMQHDVNILDAKNGLVEYTFPDNALYEGINYFQLILTKDEQTKHSPKLSYKILDVIDDSGIMAEPNYPILIQLVDEVKGLKEDTDKFLETSKTNENVRIENEKNRVQQENDRQIANKNMQNTFNEKIKEIDNTKNELVSNVNSEIIEVNNAKSQLINDVQASKTQMLNELTISKNQTESTVKNKVTEFENKIKELQKQDVVSEVNKARGKYPNLNERLDNLDKDLLKAKGLATTTVTTESNFITVENTVNGYFEDIKLEGVTLNNILPNNKLRASNGANFVITPRFIDLPVKPSTKYYVKIFDPEDKVQSFWAYSFSTGATILGTEGEFISVSDITQATSYLHVYPKADTFTQEDVEKIQVVMIEGEKQEINQYFEGMKSVGDGVDEIVISSVKGDGNLFNVNQYSDINEYTITTDNNYKQKPLFIGTHSPVKVNVTLKKNCLGCNAYFLISNERGAISNWVTITHDTQNRPTSFEEVITPDADGYVYISFISALPTVTLNTILDEYVDSVCISKQSLPSYTQYKSETKKVLCYDTETKVWKKPILREWDSIEKHSDNKYYYHKRSEERVYQEGDESNPNVITNKTNSVYKLEEEKIYECTPIDLITFENQTNYIVESGALSPKTTIKVQNYIGNVINTLKEKVSYLEDKLYKTNLANFTVALNTLDTKLKLEQLTKTPK